MRKRYGKIVRQGLPTLRFHEYKILTRVQLQQPQLQQENENEKATSEAVHEDKDGPVLFLLIPDIPRKREKRGTMTLKARQNEILALRREVQSVRQQLKLAHETIAQHAMQIAAMNNASGVSTAAAATAAAAGAATAAATTASANTSVNASSNGSRGSSSVTTLHTMTTRNTRQKRKRGGSA